jgi:hypothetical protein
VFQPAVPVAKVLERIHTNQYLLPAIQREFVWDTDQIRALFDSLMRGYPIGSFLLWQVHSDNVGDFTFYHFITDFHERDHPYAAKAYVPPGSGLTAVLDGQQRLTALNVGLYGSHAEKLPRLWWDNPNAFPKKRLYLNLLADSDDEEMGLTYDFRFLTTQEASAPPEAPDRWFLVRQVLDLKDAGPAIMQELKDRRLLGETEPYDRLYRLFMAVREEPSFNAYLEESQDSNKVLDIFVRVNSGGTTLSHSDLLLSMATNQWKELDAREEVRSLVAELNDLPAGFQFSKDLVLKAGLVLTNVPDIGFKVSNFTQSNMQKLEAEWDRVRNALLTAANLLSRIGYTGRTLTAASVMIPLAFYLDKRGLGSNYLESGHEATDRLAIQHWVARSLMKRGIWGSGLDRFLNRLRDVIREHGNTGFPVPQIEAAMTSLGKSLTFQPAEADELLDLTYGSPRIFPVLATLYPGVDLSNSFHEDHVYPKSKFARSKLLSAGVAPDLIDEHLDKVNRLPNLQLLPGVQNTEKLAKLPTEWLAGPNFASEESRRQYELDNDLDLVGSLPSFLDFYAARRERMAHRLRNALGLPGNPQLPSLDKSSIADE